MGACVSSQQGALETNKLTSMQKALFDSVKEPETPQSGRILSGSQVCTISAASSQVEHTGGPYLLQTALPAVQVSVGQVTSEAVKEERAGPSPLSVVDN